VKAQHQEITLQPDQSMRLLRWQDNLREVDSILGPGHFQRTVGMGDRWHFHHEMELTAVVTGRGTRYVGDHIESFENLDVVLLGPNVPHLRDGLHGSTGYSLQWRKDNYEGLFELPETRHLSSLWVRSAHGLHFGGVTGRAVLERMVRMAGCNRCTRLAQFIEVMDLLATAPDGEVRELSQKAFDLSDVHGQQSSIERVIHHISANFHQPIALEPVLKLAGMSKATFTRQFTRHTGKTFSDFVNEVRLANVCREIRQGRLSVSEAAYANGFNNLSYFNRTFRRVLGCSPRQWLQDHSKIPT
jgi:AraC-like DNA-binding protein